MAEEHHHGHTSHECEEPTITTVDVETKDRGMFDFLGKKKEEKPQEEVIVTEFEKVHVSEPEPKFEDAKFDEEEEKKPSLLEKLHRSDSSSSSSSDEEEGEGGEKKKKKKGLKEKIKEKVSGEKEEEKVAKEEHHVHEDTSVPVEFEKCEEVVPVHAEPTPPEEKKGLLDKIKDKLPGQHKKTEEVVPPQHPPPPPPPVECAPAPEAHEAEAKEKKGIFEKIKEKIPGYHPKTEEEKEKEKPACASH